MRRKVLMTSWTAVLATALAAPADALDVPPIDTARWGVAYDLGATSVGGLLSLGPLQLGSAAYMAVVPGLGNVGGLSASLACRMTPRESGSLAWGLGLTGYAVGGLSVQSNEVQGYALYPTVIGTLPLGDEFVLRAAGGPVLFTGQTDWMLVGAGQRVMRGATGFLSFVPNLEVVWRMKDGSEVTFGGFPSLVGWRFAL